MIDLHICRAANSGRSNRIFFQEFAEYFLDFAHKLVSKTRKQHSILVETDKKTCISLDDLNIHRKIAQILYKINENGVQNTAVYHFGWMVFHFTQFIVANE